MPIATGAEGVPLENAMPVVVSYRWNAPGTFEEFFVAPRKMRVHAITARIEVVGSDGGAVTAVVQKAADTKAYNDASVKVLHTGSINLKGTADTKQVLSLTATPADLNLNAGDCLMIVPTGVTTAAKGHVTIELIPLQ